MKGRTLLRRAAALACWPWTYAQEVVTPGVRILMYHRVHPGISNDQLTVHPDRFDEQLGHLSAHHCVLSLPEVVNAWRSGEQPAGVVLTFDDGYLDNLTFALPVLQKYRLPATIFVTSAFCDQLRRHPRYAEEAGRLHFDCSELLWLSQQRGITIGSHTISHPYLRQLDDAAAWREISGSRERIAAMLRRPVDHFCYPSGDAGSRELIMAQRAGYHSAVTVAPGANRSPKCLYSLMRTEITQKDGTRDLAFKLAGAYDPLHALLHRRRQKRFASLIHTSGEH